MGGSRRPSAAGVTFVLLLAVLAALVYTLTPWQLSTEQASQPASVAKYFTSSQINRSETYHDAARWPAWLGLAASLLGAVVLAFSGLGRYATNLVRRHVRRRGAHVVVLTALVLAFQLVITAPFDIWSSIVARHYGLTTQTWLGWVQDRSVGLVLTVTLASLCLWAMVTLARRWSQRWWLPGSAAAVIVVFGLSFVYPVVVEPMFNRFTPMQATALRAELVQYAEQDGLDVSGVLVSDASRRTSAYNAYVSGFGATKRLVVYDTLLDDIPDSQVEVIVAHELGHARDHDVLRGTAMGAAGGAAGVVGVFLLLRSSWWRRRAGAGVPGDAAVVPLVLSLVVLGGFFASPLENAVSRRIEAHADLHSLELTDDPTAFILVQQRLATNNLAQLTPDPVLSWWFDSHPAVLDRIEMGIAWSDSHQAMP